MAAFSKNPLFDFDNLPDSFSNDVRKPVPLNPDQEGSDDGDDSSGGDSDGDTDGEDGTFRPSPTPTPRPRIKGAESSFRDVKPDLKPQYGETIITPRQLGKTAVRKGVQEDLDSDDEIIWNMKHSGYKDEPIAARLVHEGRTHYDPKTIATRWGRMVRVQRKKEQKILDEDFSDYHEEEDNQLPLAVANAEATYLADLAKADTKRWENVAKLVNLHFDRKKYTKNSARARYYSLQSKTAIPPLEQDPHAPERRANRLRMRMDRDAARTEQRDTERRNRKEKIMKKEQEEREKIQFRKWREEDLRKRRLETEAKRKQQKVKRELAMKFKAEEDESKAEKKVTQALERSRRQKETEEMKAAKKWDADQQKQARQQKKDEEELRRIQDDAEKRIKKILGAKEDNQRRELIRRHMRSAGIMTAAPLETEEMKLRRAAGVYGKKDESEEKDEKPDKELIDEGMQEPAITWGPNTARGRAQLKKAEKDKAEKAEKAKETPTKKWTRNSIKSAPVIIDSDPE